MIARLSLLMLISAVTALTYAQSNIDQSMKKERAFIEKMLGDRGFKTFEDRFDRLVKEFKAGHRKDSFFNNRNFDKFFNNWSSRNKTKQINWFWRESKTHKNLIIKYKRQKDTPINIKIKDGRVRVSGSTENEVITKNASGKIISEEKSIQSFDETILLPGDINPEKAKIEAKNDEIIIKFSKR